MTTARPSNILAAAIAAAFGSNADHAAAQQAEALPDPIRIEVTGSRIAHIDGETALPVQIIRRDEIDRGNWTTAAELLSYVSANLGGTNNAMSAGSLAAPGTIGLSSANLRGLGESRTLVLLNGRRLSNYAFAGSTVDLSKIPLAAVDRVEILKDGASSIYGSDAVAGVINFITRKDFTGVAVTGQAGVTEQGGGNHYQATATAGWGDLTRDRFNVFVTVDWQKDTVLVASQRSFAATGYLPDEGIVNVGSATFPSNIRRGNTFLNPVAATGCEPPTSIRVPDLPGCRYDAASQLDLLPAQEQWNAIARATWEWSAGQQLFAEFVYSRNQLEIGQPPTPASRGNTNGVPVRYPAGGPYYPTDFANANGLSGPIEVYFRTTEIGRRIATVDTDGERFVVGGLGRVAEWDYNAAYLRSVNTADFGFSSGYLSTPGFLSVMGTGLVNPFGPSGEAGLALMRGAQTVGTVRDAKGTLDLFDASFSRDVARLPAGPVSVAIGGEWRREHLTDEPSTVLANQEIINVVVPIVPVEGSRTAGAVFAEINIPLMRGVELGASLRYDHYSDFGGTTNPKIAIRWQPVSSLLLRGTAGTGFLAPTLPNLFTPQSGAFVSNPLLVDPVRCPVTHAPDDCGQGTFLFVQGGNPRLRPETSTQYSAGAVWEPTPGASLGVQWWRIDVANVINNYGPADAFLDYDRLAPDHIVRGPPDPAYPGLPGPIVAVLGLYENVGNLSTSGVDVTIGARYTHPAAGTFRFSLNGTYILDYLFSPPGGSKIDLAGTGSYTAVPRWRHYAEVAWQRGPWGASLAQLFQSGYSDQSLNLPPRDVGTYGLWNLQGVYSGFRDWSIAAGIRNLFDTAPPFSNQTRVAQVGYDPSYADPRGRTFYLRAGYAFR